jgi:hypothetical protein
MVVTAAAIVFSPSDRPTAAEGENPDDSVVTKRLGIMRWAYRPPVISADGCHAAFVTRRGGAMRVFRDGKESRAYRVIFKNGPTFRNGTVLEFLAVADKDLLRVRHVPPE